MALGRRCAQPTVIHREMLAGSWELQLLRVCMRVWAVCWSEGEFLRAAQRHETPADKPILLLCCWALVTLPFSVQSSPATLAFLHLERYFKNILLF